MMEYFLNVVVGVLLGGYARTGGHAGRAVFAGIIITVAMSIVALVFTSRQDWRDSFNPRQKLLKILGLLFVDSVFRAVVIGIGGSLTYLIFGVIR